MHPKLATAEAAGAVDADVLDAGAFDSGSSDAGRSALEVVVIAVLAEDCRIVVGGESSSRFRFWRSDDGSGIIVERRVYAGAGLPLSVMEGNLDSQL